jgi:hypothetical protein
VDKRDGEMEMEVEENEHSKSPISRSGEQLLLSLVNHA